MDELDAPADPDAIDLEKHRARLHIALRTDHPGWVAIPLKEIQDLIAAVEALRERVAELEGELRDVDFTLSWRSALEDKPTRIDKIKYAISVARNAEAAEASVVAQAGALRDLTHGLPDLLEKIGYSDEEGLIDKALAALSATPAKALERARNMEAIMYKLAQVAGAFLATGFGNAEDRFVAKDALAKLDALDKEKPCT